MTTPNDAKGPTKRALRIFEDMKQASVEVDLGDADLEVRGDRSELKAMRGGRWMWMEAAPSPKQLKLVNKGLLHLFGTRGGISALSFHRDGSLSFRRRFVTTRRERIAESSASFREKSDATLWTGLGMIDEFGMHENHATACYPLPGGRVMTQSEGSRPMLLNEDAGAENDLSPIGVLGDYSDSDPTAPWHRTPYTFAPIGRLLMPDIAGSRWPTTNGPTHPGLDPESGAVFFPVRRDYLRPLPLDTRAQRARARRFGVIQANLHTVVWDSRTGASVRVDIRDRNGRRARIRWGLHQCMVDDRWLVVVDSGFPAEHRQFGPLGADAKASAGRNRGDGWGPGYTGVLPLSTRIYMIEKKELLERLDTAWATGSKRVKPVTAHHFDVPGSCIHAYSGREPGAMALLVTDSFDPSEWIAANDVHLGGEKVDPILRGFGHGDWKRGHVQYVRWTPEKGLVKVNRPQDQQLFPGGQFAAEPYDEPTKSLQCTSQGAWPELLVKRVRRLYERGETDVPLRTARMALHDEGRVVDHHDVPWGFPFGSAESKTHMMVGLKYAEEDQVVDRLMIYRRNDLGRGPVAEVRSKRPGAFGIRLGLHGHYRRPS